MPVEMLVMEKAP